MVIILSVPLKYFELMSKNRDGSVKVEGKASLKFYGSKIMEQEVTHLQNPNETKITYILKEFKLTPRAVKRIQTAIQKVDKQTIHMINLPNSFSYIIEPEKINLQTFCPIEDSIFCCETIEHILRDEYRKKCEKAHKK